MTTMRRPMRSSGVYHSAMPDRIWRLPWGPRSTSRRRSLSALGMRSATRIWATRSSILAKSSMAIWGVVGCWLSVVGGVGWLAKMALAGSGPCSEGEVVRGGAAGSVEGVVLIWFSAKRRGFSEVCGAGFSMSVMICASPLSARGKMGPSGPSLVPGLRPPHWRFFSSPSAAACSIDFSKPSCFQTFAVA